MARRIGLALETETSPTYTDSIGATLSAFKFTDPEPITEYAAVPGRLKGDLDLSNALTDGRIIYNNRTLTFRLELSGTTRALRQALAWSLKNHYVGHPMRFYIPDQPWGDYVKGKMQMNVVTDDNSHLIMDITAKCEPYVYRAEKDTLTMGASTTPKSYKLKATADPEDFLSFTGLVFDHEVRITGGDYTIAAADGAWSYTLGEGTYYLPELDIGISASTTLQGYGTGTCTVTFREAFL